MTMEQEYVQGPNGEKLKLVYQDRPESWTDKEIMAAILVELQKVNKEVRNCRLELEVIKLQLKRP